MNALAAGPFAQVDYDGFAAAGVARISLGSSLARITHRAIADAARAMFDQGDFTPLGHGIAGSEVGRRGVRALEPPLALEHEQEPGARVRQDLCVGCGRVFV